MDWVKLRNREGKITLKINFFFPENLWILGYDGLEMMERNIDAFEQYGSIRHSQGLLYHRTCKHDFLCNWPSLNSYLK